MQPKEKWGIYPVHLESAVCDKLLGDYSNIRPDSKPAHYSSIG